jgi:hypothetical protein
MATLLCTCIFLAIGFYNRTEYVSFAFAISSLAFLIGALIINILLSTEAISLTIPLVEDPSLLSLTIFYFLFWFAFLILLIFSSISFKHDTESKNERNLRYTFFVLFGLSLFVYFLANLDYYVILELETYTVYTTFFNVLSILELVCAVATGILLVLAVKKKE